MTTTAASPVVTARVSHSVLAPDGLKTFLKTTYPLHGPLTCELIELGLNDTYLVSTQKARCILRIYRAGWRSSDDVAYELELLDHLAMDGVPVSAPIRTRNGALSSHVRAPEGVRYVALFRYASGTPVKWREEWHGCLAGGLLAKIHAAADSFTTCSARVPLDLDYLLDSSLATCRPFLAERRSDWEYLKRLADRLRGRIEAACAELDWGPCHGDFGAANLHSAGRSWTVFDFDLCGPGWRAYDLVVPHWGTRARAGRISLWESFLHGYRDVRRLSATDVEFVPVFEAIRHLWSIGLRATNAAYAGSRLDDAYLDYRLRRFRCWEAEYLDELT